MLNEDTRKALIVEEVKRLPLKESLKKEIIDIYLDRDSTKEGNLVAKTIEESHAIINSLFTED